MPILELDPHHQRLRHRGDVGHHPRPRHQFRRRPPRPVESNSSTSRISRSSPSTCCTRCPRRRSGTACSAPAASPTTRRWNPTCASCGRMTMWSRSWRRSHRPRLRPRTAVRPVPNQVERPTSTEPTRPRAAAHLGKPFERIGAGVPRHAADRHPSDYRKPFWRAARHALRRGQIDAVLGMGFIAHHLIQFTREALRGEQNASYYSTKLRTAEPAHTPELATLRKSA